MGPILGIFYQHCVPSRVWDGYYILSSMQWIFFHPCPKFYKIMSKRMHPTIIVGCVFAITNTHILCCVSWDQVSSENIVLYLLDFTFTRSVHVVYYGVLDTQLSQEIKVFKITSSFFGNRLSSSCLVRKGCGFKKN